MQVLDESEVTVHFCKNVFWSSMQHLHLTPRFNWAMFSKSLKCENIEIVKTGLHFTKSCFWKKLFIASAILRFSLFLLEKNHTTTIEQKHKVKIVNAS